MPRKTTAWAAICMAVVLLSSGCRFFGIDTRPDIRYVTEGQRKNVSEPMYSMPVASTGLFKQWPMRLGADYGYAPWERKPAAEHPPASTLAAANPAASSPTSPPANAPDQTTSTAKAAKPSHRATPRLAGGELAEAASTSAAISGDTGTSGDAEHATHVAANDFDVPAAARGTLDFRVPTTASTASAGVPQSGVPSRSAAAVVSRAAAGSSAKQTPSKTELPWRSANDELAGDDAGLTSGPASTSSATSIGLQQPGVFSARKTVTAPRVQPRSTTAHNRNALRDEAVRPAAATMPVRQPGATPLRGPAGIPHELIPPDDDPVDGLPGDLPIGTSHGASIGSPNDHPIRSLSDPGQRNPATQLAAPPTAIGRPAATAGPTVVRASPRYDSRDADGREYGDREYNGREDGIHEDDGKTVFVTATDMGDEHVPVARMQTNPFVSSHDSGASGAGRDTYRDPRQGVLGELEAAKRNILP